MIETWTTRDTREKQFARKFADHEQETSVSRGSVGSWRWIKGAIIVETLTPKKCLRVAKRSDISSAIPRK